MIVRYISAILIDYINSVNPDINEIKVTKVEDEGNNQVKVIFDNDPDNYIYLLKDTIDDDESIVFEDMDSELTELINAKKYEIAITTLREYLSKLEKMPKLNLSNIEENKKALGDLTYQYQVYKNLGFFDDLIKMQEKAQESVEIELPNVIPLNQWLIMRSSPKIYEKQFKEKDLYIYISLINLRNYANIFGPLYLREKQKDFINLLNTVINKDDFLVQRSYSDFFIVTNKSREYEITNFLLSFSNKLQKEDVYWKLDKDSASYENDMAILLKKYDYYANIPFNSENQNFLRALLKAKIYAGRRHIIYCGNDEKFKKELDELLGWKNRFNFSLDVDYQDVTPDVGNYMIDKANKREALAITTPAFFVEKINKDKIRIEKDSTKIHIIEHFFDCIYGNNREDNGEWRGFVPSYFYNKEQVKAYYEEVKNEAWFRELLSELRKRDELDRISLLLS